ncbi:MAG TPA: M23 family metallopeptidase [Acidimicrobiales bacterium]|nr:M23 family metallopeptidase [Acidimicrobiales bacterium]
MRRNRLVAGALAVVVASALCGAPAVAQSSTTDPRAASTTTTTTIEGSSSTTDTTSPTAATDPGVHGDAPPESVPNVSVTIPPREPPTGAGAGAVGPLPGRIVTVDLRAARASALARQGALEAATTLRSQLEASLEALHTKVDALGASARQAVRDLASARDELRARAVDAYVRGNGFDAISIGTDGDGPASQRATLLGVVVEQDNAAVERVKQLQAKVSNDQAQTAKDIADTQSQLDAARVAEAQALIDFGDAKLDLAVSSAGGNIVIHGFVFPVADPHTFSEDFGDPRLPGTPNAHFHQGCDVVAAEGTELYAAERGVITQISDSALGGHGLWIKGESGTAYYYAHLSAYAAGLKEGQLVDGGDLVGYVGHTGDAYGPHLHFEVHPGGGSAIDPYPILLASEQQRVSP